MIPAKKETHQVISTLDGREIEMEIDRHSLHHIMQVLTNLYSDPEYAVLREYATNALDSHIEAGNKAPIEVYLPTALEPVLRIVDHGIGLNEQDIAEVYSKYGLSTKTETNDQTGCLGLGCKSALSYTNQFTVLGTKHGVRTSVSVGVDEDGIGMMTVVDTEDTDDPNGVEIMVPVKPRNSFAARAAKLFRFWPEGSVLVNGEPPQPLPQGLKIGDITLYRGLDDEENYLLMGSVPYPIDAEQMEQFNTAWNEQCAPDEIDAYDFGLSDEYTFVATVPNGAVHFAPSREALYYTTRTKEVLRQLVATFKMDLASAITKEIESAPDKPTALRTAIRWHLALPKALQAEHFSYRGVEIPAQIFPEDHAGMARFAVSQAQREFDWYGKPTKIGAHSRVQHLDLIHVPDSMFVHGFNQSFTPNAKKKIWTYLDQRGIGYPERFVMSLAKPTSPWIAPEQMLDWEPISQIKIPRYVKGTKRLLTGRIPGSYDMWLKANGSDPQFADDVPADDIDTSIPLFVTVSGGKTYGTQLAHFEDDFTLVILTINRLAKFKRLFPEAQDPSTYLIHCAKVWWDSLRAVERDAIRVSHSIASHDFDHLYISQIADPAIRKTARLRKFDLTHLSAMLKILRSYLNLELWPQPLTSTNYPLYQSYAHGCTPRKLRMHNTFYINAVYQHSQEQ